MHALLHYCKYVDKSVYAFLPDVGSIIFVFILKFVSNLCKFDFCIM